MWNARLLPDASIMENAQMHSGISSLNPIVNKQKHNDLFTFPEQPHPFLDDCIWITSQQGNKPIFRQKIHVHQHINIFKAKPGLRCLNRVLSAVSSSLQILPILTTNGTLQIYSSVEILGSSGRPEQEIQRISSEQRKLQTFLHQCLMGTVLKSTWIWFEKSPWKMASLQLISVTGSTAGDCLR